MWQKYHCNIEEYKDKSSLKQKLQEIAETMVKAYPKME
jgi:hypothetical protein